MLFAMFGIGPTELAVVLVVLLLLFGPSQIPKIAKSFGQSIRAFRQAGDELTEVGDTLNQESKNINQELR